jgi:quercetin dioxygenase-like cupin family protein
VDITPTPDAQTLTGPAEWFTGAVSIQAVGAAEAPGRTQANLVSFADGARTAWHTHPYGQILHVLHGVARVQSEGGDVVDIGPGTSVRFAPGENHWHGASPGHAMIHLAIQEADEDGSPARWGRHVSDAEYLGRTA